MSMPVRNLFIVILFAGLTAACTEIVAPPAVNYAVRFDTSTFLLPHNLEVGTGFGIGVRTTVLVADNSVTFTTGELAYEVNTPHTAEVILRPWEDSSTYSASTGDLVAITYTQQVQVYAFAPGEIRVTIWPRSDPRKKRVLKATAILPKG